MARRLPTWRLGSSLRLQGAFDCHAFGVHRLGPTGSGRFTIVILAVPQSLLRLASRLPRCIIAPAPRTDRCSTADVMKGVGNATGRSHEPAAAHRRPDGQDTGRPGSAGRGDLHQAIAVGTAGADAAGQHPAEALRFGDRQQALISQRSEPDGPAAVTPAPLR